MRTTFSLIVAVLAVSIISGCSGEFKIGSSEPEVRYVEIEKPVLVDRPVLVRESAPARMMTADYRPVSYQPVAEPGTITDASQQDERRDTFNISGNGNSVVIINHANGDREVNPDTRNTPVARIVRASKERPQHCITARRAYESKVAEWDALMTGN